MPPGWYEPLDVGAIAALAGKGQWASVDLRAANIVQAQAELALSLGTELPWETESEEDRAQGRRLLLADGTCSVGGHRVRWDAPRGELNRDCRLRVWPWDPDDVAFCLVVGESRAFDFVGWMLGREAKRPEWLIGRGPAGRIPDYAVPPESLRSADTLPRRA